MLGNRKEGNQVQCRDFREIADSYLSDELLIETNHDLLRHLEVCRLSRELAARRELRRKLREGFQHSDELQISDEFANTLKAQLRDVAMSRSSFLNARRVAYVAIAASLIIAAAFVFRLVKQRWSQHPPSANEAVNSNGNTGSEPDGIRSAVLNAALAESAVGDHLDCALNHRLPEKPIPLEEAGRIYDRAYLDLISAVTSNDRLPAGVEIVGGHSCVFKGRRFGHVVLKYHGRLISVLVTNIEKQESTTSTGPEQQIASSYLDGYQLASFATGRHVVYVVSDLNNSENLSIARAVAPSVTRHIENAERKA